ncbi:hypothetical protein BCS93_08855 [Vibrio breoganii]|uniref:Glycosyltransferase 2-like domain-containing protein n=1 Tax=Vibrio breoganii TaxID=553239 RepID=A0AAP8SXB9_9VIBR|nr:glycosyltransferase family 2 protein [Vibrio breoganii]PMP11311.1 hypothetical protein BCS93_08855 [Vibrio breoganii]
MISVCIVTYNRLDCLVKTIDSIRNTLDSINLDYEIIVSDDCSPIHVQEKIKNIHGIDHLFISETNKGLGNNTNKGLKHCRGKYIIQLQDDWIYIGKPEYILNAMKILENNQSISIVNFIKDQNCNYFTNYLDDIEYRILTTESSKESKVSHLPYTDNPHIKRLNFHNEVGYYKENVPMTIMETEFARRISSFEDNLIVDLSTDLFLHIGDHKSFNPGRRKQKLKNFITSTPVLKQIFTLYKVLKK